MENELTSLGTVLAYTGKKGTLKMKDNNLNGTKRIIVRLYNKAGKEMKAICSTAVTEQLRAKTIAVGQLMTLELMENETGLVFICQPQGKDIVYNVEDLKIREIETAEINMEDYLVL